ncbi:CYTH and CHAD domain-containing protein [Arenibaculum pallidiluteum]|uniref:CYTH and CHAD domain-containing protein n=1 Tax=Arenibaculum pallidiluteum TaxID=2812559 RepID=UPI001A95A3B4|nr:CYTH and CHAD domain-containing protein [Arenibaculum pallidiluteum]
MGNTEIELKLRIQPEDLGRVAELRALAAGQPERAPKRLESVYFDTEDRRLRRGGLSLRVRTQDGTHVQTLKAADGSTGPLFDRAEWEVPVPERRPDLVALDGEVRRARLAGVEPSELKPAFSVEVRRAVRLLDLPGGSVEVAIDEGEIRTADGRCEPVAELELELKVGRPEALYDLALGIAEAIPVRIETRAKSDRGYDLISPGVPPVVKAGNLDLPPEATTEEAVERIIRHCLAHMMANERAVVEAGLPEGIHQMRVALRRLRSAVSLFRRMLPRDQAEWLSAETRWIAAELGTVRDWDVFGEELLGPVAAALPGDQRLGLVAEAASAAREAACASLRASLGSQRYTALVLRLGRWLEARSWRHQDLSEDAARLFTPVRAHADVLLDRRHRQARKRGAGFADMDTEGRHRLRIALKKLRYISEFFRSLYEGRAYDRYLKQLSALQQTLGHLNDVATARRLVETLAQDVPDGQAAELWVGGGLVQGWHAHGLIDLEPELVADWEHFSKAKPFWDRPAASR